VEAELIFYRALVILINANIFLLLVGCATVEVQKENTKYENENSDEIRLNKKYFLVTYSKSFSIAKSVEYSLLSNNLRNARVKRKNKFFVDPELIQLQLNAIDPTEYKGSGYDRGHLAPSADFSWSMEANEETFVMSNMVPQSPNLNRGAWRRVEETVRKWACTEGHLLVVTGPVLEENLLRHKDRLTIPKTFFKVVLDRTPPRKAIGFILSQSSRTDGSVAKFSTTVDDVEKITGLNFFEEISDEEQNSIESVNSYNEWKEVKCF
jgi:endonuclease G, mitochondrial